MGMMEFTYAALTFLTVFGLVTSIGLKLVERWESKGDAAD